MKPTVYIETSVIGYLAMRPSNLLQVAAHQQTTREWWDNERHKYELFISRYVVEECSAGDPIAAEERLQFLTGIPLLKVSDDILSLAQSLLDEVGLPEKAAVDALHISVAAANGIQFLVTWNCRHIANLSLRRPIEELCRKRGFESPTLCTPQQLMELHNDA